MVDFTRFRQRIGGSVEDAVRKLVNVEHFRAGSFVSMPIIYPSGSTVVLEVTTEGDRCFVSDRGGGFHEAEIYGASRYFKSEAQRIATAAQIRFDGRDMFVAEVPIENLHGAMTVVANCSAEAANAAALRLADRSDKDATEDLYLRLSSLYKARDVQKDIQINGARHKWRVSVAVLDQPELALFEPVSGAYVSAVGVVAKFQDFAARQDPPSRYGVMKSVEDLKDYYGLVAAASTKLVPVSAPDETFIDLLKAAA